MGGAGAACAPALGLRTAAEGWAGTRLLEAGLHLSAETGFGDPARLHRGWGLGCCYWKRCTGAGLGGCCCYWQRCTHIPAPGLAGLAGCCWRRCAAPTSLNRTHIPAPLTLCSVQAGSAIAPGSRSRAPT